MAAPQVVVIAPFVAWGQPIPAALVSAFLLGQLMMMAKFMAAPVEKALWYSGFGVPLYVFGIMASAFALRFAGP